MVSSASPAPSPVDTASQTVPSSSATLSCPETSVSRGVSTSVLAVSPSTGAGAGSGALAVQALTPDRPTRTQRVGTSEDRGVPVSAELDADARLAVTVDAAGGLAPGAFGAQQTVADHREDVGIAVARCEPTADDWWFTGADTSVGSTSRLVLTNPAPAVSVVDL